MIMNFETVGKLTCMILFGLSDFDRFHSLFPSLLFHDFFNDYFIKLDYNIYKLTPYTLK